MRCLHDAAILFTLSLPAFIRDGTVSLAVARNGKEQLRSSPNNDDIKKATTQMMKTLLMMANTMDPCVTVLHQ